MPHPKDKWVAETLPNGWVILEEGDAIPRDRMYNRRNAGEEWKFTNDRQSTVPYDPDQHRALARRAAPSEREW